jgi:hypothetical protein
MLGPSIIARTMSVPTQRGGREATWQYHSRSDNHSKLACWTVLLDLMLECDVFRSAAEAGRVGFGINHVMVGPINKTLDLVVTVAAPHRSAGKRLRFVDLIERYGIVLTTEEKARIADLPTILHDLPDDISEVAIALEAKACMTEHVKSIPRLHAEILATGYLAKRATPRSIVVSYSLVNAASTFVTPSGAGKKNKHNMPEDAARVVQMLRTAIPRVQDGGVYGFDAIGVTVLDCANDGRPVMVIDQPPAPALSDAVRYERMIVAICSEYRNRFG